ncbi:hypothetical protein EUGRSUZ_I00680 [Eucalyptus grandis]|uniref:Uncharacterized protein n=2 Tax=Eucalyptus grandis TaxID=71139 RepID=A0ACC3JD34_EUCGR|nr:hypothetical protein EUGRSUZ_I00680 [Eucalyptus grandis]
MDFSYFSYKTFLNASFAPIQSKERLSDIETPFCETQGSSCYVLLLETYHYVYVCLLCQLISHRAMARF